MKKSLPANLCLQNNASCWCTTSEATPSTPRWPLLFLTLLHLLVAFVPESSASVEQHPGDACLTMIYALLDGQPSLEPERCWDCRRKKCRDLATEANPQSGSLPYPSLSHRVSVPFAPS